MHGKKIKDRYEVPLSIVLFFLILFWLSKYELFILLAFAVGILSLLSRSLAYLITHSWQKLIKALGFVNAHVLLTLIFYILLLPIALIYRWRNKDSLNLKSGKASYYTDRDHKYTPADLENPW